MKDGARLSTKPNSTNSLVRKILSDRRKRKRLLAATSVLSVLTVLVTVGLLTFPAISLSGAEDELMAQGVNVNESNNTVEMSGAYLEGANGIQGSASAGSPADTAQPGEYDYAGIDRSKYVDASASLDEANVAAPLTEDMVVAEGEAISEEDAAAAKAKAKISLTYSAQAQEALANADLSSLRLLVGTEDKSIVEADENLVANHESLYLLQYTTEADAQQGFLHYFDAADFVAPDLALEVADEAGNGAAAEGALPEGVQENENGILVNADGVPVVTEEVAVPAQDQADPAEAPLATETVFTEEANPFAELESALEGDVAPATKEAAENAEVNLIAVIDTGIAGKAEDNANVVEAVSMLGEEFADADGNPLPNYIDENGHGQRMVDFVVEENPDARILAIKALDASGKGNVSAVIAAINYAMDRGANIINLSAAAYASEENAALAAAVRAAEEAGVVVVGAAGNQGFNAKYYIPGNIAEALVVGAASEVGVRLANSNFGETVDYNVVAASTSEAAARTAGFVSLYGEQGPADVLNQGKFFAVDFVPEVITLGEPEADQPEEPVEEDAKPEETPESFEDVEAQDNVYTVGSWAELKEAVTKTGPMTIKVTKDLIAEDQITINKHVTIISNDASKPRTIYRKPGAADFPVFNVVVAGGDPKSLTLGNGIVMSGKQAEYVSDEQTTPTGESRISYTVGNTTSYMAANSQNVVRFDTNNNSSEYAWVIEEVSNGVRVKNGKSSKYLYVSQLKDLNTSEIYYSVGVAANGTGSLFTVEGNRLVYTDSSGVKHYLVKDVSAAYFKKQAYITSDLTPMTVAVQKAVALADNKQKPYSTSSENGEEFSGNKGFFVEVNGGTFTMTGTAELRDFVSVNDTTAPANTAPVVVNSGTFNMEGGAISNNATGIPAGASVKLGDYANLNKDERNANAETTNGNAGAVRVTGGTANIKDGVIAANKGDAGAIWVENGTLNMTGGQIKQNNGFHAGAVYMKAGAFNLHSGVIGGKEGDSTAATDGNTSILKGGAVTVLRDASMLMDIYTYANDAARTRSNAKDKNGNNITVAPQINYNRSMDKGGAIYVGSDNVNLIRGQLAYNQATWMGGAIYVQGDSIEALSILTMGSDLQGNTVKAYIYENTAKTLGNVQYSYEGQAQQPTNITYNGGAYWPRSGLGGGVWYCAWSTVLHDENKVLINNNYLNGGTTTNTNWGVDVQKMSGSGMIAEWNNAGNNWKKGQGGSGGTFTSSDVPFYGAVALQNNTSETIVRNPNTNLIIHHNEAELGGGMGLNGIITFRSLPVYKKFATAQLDLTKTWFDENDQLVADPEDRMVELAVTFKGKNAENQDFEQTQTFFLRKGLVVNDTDGTDSSGLTSNGWTAHIKLPAEVLEITEKNSNNEPLWSSKQSTYEALSNYNGTAFNPDTKKFAMGNYEISIQETVYEKAAGTAWPANLLSGDEAERAAAKASLTVVDSDSYSLNASNITVQKTGMDTERHDTYKQVYVNVTAHFTIGTTLSNTDEAALREVKIKKVDENGQEIAANKGAKFTLFKADGNIPATAIAADGTVTWGGNSSATPAQFSGGIQTLQLKKGTYYVKEAVAPTGYIGYGADKKITFVVGDETTQLRGIADAAYETEGGVHYLTIGGQRVFVMNGYNSNNADIRLGSGDNAVTVEPAPSTGALSENGSLTPGGVYYLKVANGQYVGAAEWGIGVRDTPATRPACQFVYAPSNGGASQTNGVNALRSNYNYALYAEGNSVKATTDTTILMPSTVVGWTNDNGTVTVSVKNTEENYSLGFKKVDGSTPLPGAGFTLYNASGVAQGTEQTSADSTGTFSFTGLKSGTYYIEETTKPQGYDPLNAQVLVQIEPGGNKKYLGVVESVGVDSETGQLMLGGKPLYAASQENNAAITTTKTAFPLYLTEGADGRDNKTPAYIKSLGALAQKDFFYIQVGTSGYYIKDGGSAPIVYGSNVASFKWKLERLSNGALVLCYQPESSYMYMDGSGQVKTTKNANSVLVANTNIAVAANNNSANLETTVKNQKAKYNVRIRKVDSENQNTGLVASFRIYKKGSGSSTTVTTGTDGWATFSDLTMGHYSVQESSWPSGYVKPDFGDNEWFDIYVNADGTVRLLSTTTTPAAGKDPKNVSIETDSSNSLYIRALNERQIPTIKVRKVKMDNSTLVDANVKFQIREAAANGGSTAYDMVSLGNGEYSFDFHNMPGYDATKIYYIWEQVEPNGYQRVNSNIPFRVASDGTINGTMSAQDKTRLNGYGNVNFTEVDSKVVYQGSSATILVRNAKKFNVNITKYDETGANALGGAAFTLKKSTGESIGNAQGPAANKSTFSFTLTEAGDYYIEETTTPNKYYESHERIAFTLDNMGNMTAKGAANVSVGANGQLKIGGKLVYCGKKDGLDYFNTEEQGSPVIMLKGFNGSPATAEDLTKANAGTAFWLKVGDKYVQARRHKDGEWIPSYLRLQDGNWGHGDLTATNMQYVLTFVRGIPTLNVSTNVAASESGYLYLDGVELRKGTNANSAENILYNSDNVSFDSATNTYSVSVINYPKPVKAHFEAKKELYDNGEQATIGAGDFTFKLEPKSNTAGYAVNKMPMPSSNTAATQAGTTASVVFGDIEFEKVGTYVYTISEVKGSNANMTYDKRTYDASVVVDKDTENGGLKATVKYKGNAGTVIFSESENNYAQTVGNEFKISTLLPGYRWGIGAYTGNSNTEDDDFYVYCINMNLAEPDGYTYIRSTPSPSSSFYSLAGLNESNFMSGVTKDNVEQKLITAIYFGSEGAGIEALKPSLSASTRAYLGDTNHGLVQMTAAAVFKITYGKTTKFTSWYNGLNFTQAQRSAYDEVINKLTSKSFNDIPDSVRSGGLRLDVYSPKSGSRQNMIGLNSIVSGSDEFTKPPVFRNDGSQAWSITLNKKDNAGASLEGATFTLYKSQADMEAKQNGITINGADPASSEFRWGDLLGSYNGVTYYIVEDKAPAGHVRLTAPIVVKLKESGNTGSKTATLEKVTAPAGVEVNTASNALSITAPNSPVTCDIKLFKVDASANKLDNAKFTLTKADPYAGTSLASFGAYRRAQNPTESNIEISKNNGWSKTGLATGWYVLEETTAPAGFELSRNPWFIHAEAVFNSTTGNYEPKVTYYKSTRLYGSETESVIQLYPNLGGAYKSYQLEAIAVDETDKSASLVNAEETQFKITKTSATGFEGGQKFSFRLRLKTDGSESMNRAILSDAHMVGYEPASPTSREFQYSVANGARKTFTLVGTKEIPTQNNTSVMYWDYIFTGDDAIAAGQTITIFGLPKDVVCVVDEVVQNNGAWELASKSWTVVKDGGQVVKHTPGAANNGNEVTFVNYKWGDVFFNKVDEDGQPIDRIDGSSSRTAEFVLVSGALTDAEAAKEAATNASQVIKTSVADASANAYKFTDVENGTYWLVETKAPNGYLVSEPVKIQVAVNSQGKTEVSYLGGSQGVVRPIAASSKPTFDDAAIVQGLGNDNAIIDGAPSSAYCLNADLGVPVQEIPYIMESYDAFGAWSGVVGCTNNNPGSTVEDAVALQQRLITLLYFGQNGPGNAAIGSAVDTYVGRTELINIHKTDFVEAYQAADAPTIAKYWYWATQGQIFKAVGEDDLRIRRSLSDASALGEGYEGNALYRGMNAILETLSYSEVLNAYGSNSSTLNLNVLIPHNWTQEHSETPKVLSNEVFDNTQRLIAIEGIEQIPTNFYFVDRPAYELTIVKGNEWNSDEFDAKVESGNLDGINAQESMSLAGAEFTLKDVTPNDSDFIALHGNSNGKYYTKVDGIVEWISNENGAKITTGEDGIAPILTGLLPGEYILHEVKQPNGDYEGIDGNSGYFWKIKIAGDGTVSNDPLGTNEKARDLIVVNGAAHIVGITNVPKTYTLPATGGMGTYAFYVGGALLMVAAVVVLLRRGRRVEG